ncbi:MAG: response regulator transcription factor [Bdellovibrionales bacterium]|nr:response regulator transcription factor [Bdellovibrionales bacterium]
MTKRQILLVSESTSLIQTIQHTLSESTQFQISHCLSPDKDWFRFCQNNNTSVCLLAPTQDLKSFIQPYKEHNTTNIKTIIIHPYADIQNVQLAFKFGACGYISNDYITTHLVECIHHAINETAYIKISGDRSQPQPSQINDEKLSMLSDREVEVLQMIAYGYTYQDISEKLSVSPKSVETYRSRISQKLNLDTRYKMIRFALDHNLIHKNIDI